MAISYLFSNEEFKLLALTCGLRKLPVWMRETSLDDEKRLWKSLADKGYVLLDDDAAVVNRTVSFLLSEASTAHQPEGYADDGLAYITDRLCITLEPDKRAKGRCRLTPYKSREDWQKSLIDESEENADDQ